MSHGLSAGPGEHQPGDGADVGVSPRDALRATLRTTLGAALGPGYHVEREIGAGGMGRVFAATEVTTGRRVAVKVLAPALASCCDAGRFRREMALAASLEHPNIVPLLRECETCGGGRLFYFVMPYIEGESLRERLDREHTLPVPEALRVLRDVAAALAHAHARGIVHRDIKPANVLMGGGGALVADFGVAKALSTAAHASDDECLRCADAEALRGDAAGLTVAGFMLGTPAYTAPEQAVGDAATDHRADLYALGVLAYEMLAGMPPFAGRTPAALIAAHLTEMPAPLAAHAAVPPALATLVMQLLEKRPEDRPRSALAVLELLERLRAEAAITLGAAPDLVRAG